jgi:SAM-dependent methyltransferase
MALSMQTRSSERPTSPQAIHNPTGTEYPHDMLASLLRFRRKEPRDRAALLRHLAGEGIELGALNYPLDVAANRRVKRVRYVDRYPKDELLRLFPELERVADTIVETDVLCDLIHGLEPIEAGSQNFVIACHLIEHVPDPIHFIDECWRVLCEGGLLFLAAPDRRFSTDRPRPITSLDHLIDDHRRAERSIEDHHLEEYLCLTGGVVLPEDPAQRQTLFDLHRSRSIHVHVWDAPALAHFLAYCSQAAAPFTLVDAAGPEMTQRQEIVVVLRKSRNGDPKLEQRLAAALAPWQR